MKPRSNPFLVAAFVFVSAATLQAATLYWDGTDTTADADGGAGAWDTVTTNWDDAAAAGNSVAWPSVATGDDDAVFGGITGIVTVDAGGITVNDIAFNTANYEVTGGSLTLDGSLATPVINGAVNATVSANLVGTAGLTKSGNGTLTLSGDNSALSGTLTLATTTGVANAGIILSGANAGGGITQIDVNGSASPAPADGSFLGLADTSIGSGVTVNLSGQGGNSTPGTLRATSGTSTVSGPVNVLTSNTRISNFSGTSLTLAGVVTCTPASNGLYIRFGNSQGVTFTNPLNSWEGVTQVGEGSVYFYPGALPANTTVFLGGSNPAEFGTNGTFTRAIGNAAGQLNFGRASDGQRATGFSARGGDLSLNFGGAGADVVFAPVTTAASTTGTWASGASAVTVASATGIAVGMYVTGPGIRTDTRVSTISGTTVTLNRAATAAGAGAALSFITLAALDVSKVNSFTLVLNGANADSDLTLQNPLDLNGFNRFLQVNTNTTTLTGGLKNSAGSASARKTGNGTLIHDPGTAYVVSLAGFNTNAGTVELKSGTMTVTGSAPTSQPEASSGFIVSRGGTFRLNGGNVNATTGTYIFPAGNTGGGNSNFILDSGTFNGDGREVLNAYGAPGTTTLNGGLFICNGFKVTQNTGFLTLNGGTLRLNRLYGDGNTSTISFNGGILQAKQNNAGFIDANITNALVQSGGAVIDSNGFAITIPKVLTEDSGSTGGGLTKIGNGSLTLTAANTYTGPTLVNQGSLIVNANHSGATGAVTVGDGIGAAKSAILGGTGPIGSAITLDSDGTIAPGTSVGTLTAAANVSGNGTLLVEMDGAAADQLIVGGTLDISAMKLELSTINAPTENVYIIVNAASAITGAQFAAVNGTIPGYTVTYNYDDGVDTHNIALIGTPVANPFDYWATTTNGLAGGDAAATADPDNDGLDNAVEFVIGGQPNPANANANSSALAPTVSTTASNLVFTFRRTDLALTQPGVEIAAEYGSDLAGWTPATNGVGGVVIAVTSDIEPGVDQVQVSIPKALATGEKMFARLNVVIP